MNAVAIVFDPDKDATNLAKHGMSLTDADDFDWAVAVVEADVRRTYGEDRFRAFARMGGSGFCLAFTIIDDTTIRAISYRRAHDKELRRHGL